VEKQVDQQLALSLGAGSTRRQFQRTVTGGRRRKPTQAERLIDKLREARAEKRALELPEIMQLGIAQHGARIKEIRDRGFKVINELESVDGILHSRYWLIFDPERDRAHQ
jgi:hypothetical protein